MEPEPKNYEANLCLLRAEWGESMNTSQQTQLWASVNIYNNTISQHFYLQILVRLPEVKIIASLTTFFIQFKRDSWDLGQGLPAYHKLASWVCVWLPTEIGKLEKERSFSDLIKQTTSDDAKYWNIC